MIAKAESLYNVCDFEHALVLFTKGRKLAPDSDGLQAGILKCKKTILNIVCDQDVFFFLGSKHFIDYLRKQGDDSVEVFINDDNSEKTWKKMFDLVSLGTKGRRASVVDRQDKIEKRKTGKDQKEPKKQDRMKKDKEYLRQLEKSLVPLSGLQKDGIRLNSKE